ncbi:MAG: 3-dehydroquinate synthase [Kiritimatiellae bacterium]|nr:3-dehydroquinate synthase [Kiritimatiellia bacterium]
MSNETKIVSVDLGERSYDISIGSDGPVGAVLSGLDVKRALIVSDSNVAALYLPWCRKKLSEAGLEVSECVFPAGEPSKCLETMAMLYDAAVSARLDRSSVVVALGGGVVGDAAGFLAASYLRGVRFVQVPTTLLAMVDSSVGGKTGINLPQGKNLVGAFYQPVEVDINLDTLVTLQNREYRAGLAEVVKYGVIWDADLFALLEQRTDDLLKQDPMLLADVVARCCEIKAEVVSQDEREGGLRAILNFGHTLGHALENILGYGEWLHGEAVSAGMVYAAEVSVAQHGLTRVEADRIHDVLQALQLPVQWRGPNGDVAWSLVLDAMGRDKKTIGSVLKFVLSDRIGHVDFGCVVAEEALAEVFSG